MSEFYTDGGEELENVPVDPNAPKPEGSTISPAVGEQLIVPSGERLFFQFIVLRGSMRVGKQ